MASISLVAGCSHSTSNISRPSEATRGTAHWGCTEIGCWNHLYVEFTPPIVSPGPYDVSIQTDQETLDCSVQLTSQKLMPDNSSADCALFAWDGDAKRGIVGFSLMDQTPRVVTIAVVRGGLQIARGSQKPRYQTSTPNGPGCEPVCRIGRVQLDTQIVAPTHSAASD